MSDILITDSFYLGVWQSTGGGIPTTPDEIESHFRELGITKGLGEIQSQDIRNANIQALHTHAHLQVMVGISNIAAEVRKQQGRQ